CRGVRLHLAAFPGRTARRLQRLHGLRDLSTPEPLRAPAGLERPACRTTPMSETTSASSITPEFSDYLAALKRRRMLLLVVALPILACALALAIGMPDIFVSTGLITFSDA